MSVVINLKQSVPDNLLYVSLIVTTKQKPIVKTQKIKRKECKYTTKENRQTTKEEEKKKGTERNEKKC